MRIRTNAAPLTFAASAASLSAVGYPATRPEKLPELVPGPDSIGYGLFQKGYRLDTGRTSISSGVEACRNRACPAVSS